MTILNNTLRRSGINTYVAQHNPEYGYSLSKKITTAIDNCDVVVAIWAKKSTSASVNQEVGYAKKAGKLIVPLVEEGAKIGFMLGDDEQERFTSETIAESCGRVVRYVKAIGVGGGGNLGKVTSPVSKVVYCTRCGEHVGSRSSCVGLYTAHDFVNGRGIVYCARCGQRTGVKSMCIGLYASHDFSNGDGSEYCSRCGAKIGIKSQCIGLYSSHDFVR